MYHYYYDKYAVSMPPAMKQLSMDASKRIADFLRAHPIGATSAVGAAGLGLGHMVGYKSGRAVQRFEDVWDAGNRVLNNKQASYTLPYYLAGNTYDVDKTAGIGSIISNKYRKLRDPIMSKYMADLVENVSIPSLNPNSAAAVARNNKLKQVASLLRGGTPVFDLNVVGPLTDMGVGYKHWELANQARRMANRNLAAKAAVVPVTAGLGYGAYRLASDKGASYYDIPGWDKTAAPIGTMLKAGFNAIKGFGSKLAPQAKNMVNAAKGFGKEAGTLGKSAFGEAKTLAKTGWNKMQPGMKNFGNNLKTGLKQFGNEAKDVAMGNRGLVAQSALLGSAGAGLGMAGKSMFGDSQAAYSYVNPYWLSDKTAGVGAYVGGYGKGSDNAFPSALGLATAGPSASSADYVYRKRRSEGRGRLKALANSYGNAALGTLNGAVTGGLGGAILGGGIGAAIGGPAGGYVGAQLLGNLGGFGGAMAGAPNQLSLASDNSPLVHLLPTLGGAGIGGLAGAMYGDYKGENQLAYTGLGAGLGGLAGYGLSRLMN